MLERARRAPAALIVPALAATLIFLVAVTTSQIAIGLAERGQRGVIDRLGEVYLDGLSALTLPYVVNADAAGLADALGRMKTYHEGVRELRIVVRSLDGRILAAVSREDMPEDRGLPAPDARRAELGRLEDGRYWIQRPLLDGDRAIAVLSAELDSGVVVAERQRTRLVLLGIDVVLSLVLALLGYALVRAVLRPVARLERALVAANDGALAPIPADELPADGNEFGRLLRAYNAMVTALGERERLGERLADQQRVADLGRLAATVAHEVRNPVAGMLAAVDTARRFAADPGAVATSLDLVERGLRNIDEVVGATLSVYRPANESRDLTAADFDDLRLLAGPATRRRSIELRWTVDVGTSFPVDAGPIRQILLNLLLNAAGATPRGGTVALDALVRDGLLVIEVGDSGPGMPIGVRQRLADGAAVEDAHAGLGVDVVVRLLRGLDGAIEVAAEPGRGTRIVLRIPPRGDAGAPGR